MEQWFSQLGPSFKQTFSPKLAQVRILSRPPNPLNVPLTPLMGTPWQGTVCNVPKLTLPMSCVITSWGGETQFANVEKYIRKPISYTH